MLLLLLPFLLLNLTGDMKKHKQMTAALEPRPSDQLSVFHNAAKHLNFGALEWAS